MRYCIFTYCIGGLQHTNKVELYRFCFKVIYMGCYGTNFIKYMNVDIDIDMW